MKKIYKIFSSVTVLLGLSAISSIPIIKIFNTLNNNINNFNAKLEDNKTFNTINPDIQKFWKNENYSTEVMYEGIFENYLSSDDNSWNWLGYHNKFTISAKDIISNINNFSFEKKNNNLYYEIIGSSNGKFNFNYYPNIAKTTGNNGNYPMTNPTNWKVVANYPWENKEFSPIIKTSKLNSQVNNNLQEIHKNTNISLIFNNIEIENQTGITVPTSNPNWTWPDQYNTGNDGNGFRKSLSQVGDTSLNYKRTIAKHEKEIILLNQNMEQKIVKSFLKFNPDLKKEEQDLKNDLILNRNDITNNNMPSLFSLDNYLLELKELFDIYEIYKDFEIWIKENWPDVPPSNPKPPILHISKEEATEILNKIKNFKFKNHENVKHVITAIKNDNKAPLLYDGIIESSFGLIDKLVKDEILENSISKINEISLEKYSYIYKTIIGFFASNDIKISLTRRSLNDNTNFENMYIWKDGKFVTDKVLWGNIVFNPQNKDSNIEFKITNLRTSKRKNENGKLTNLISNSFSETVPNHNFFIKYRANGENWTDAKENKTSAFEIDLNQSVEDIIGSNYYYTNKENERFNIGLNNYPLGSIIDFTNKDKIITQINKVLKPQPLTTNIIHEDNLFETNEIGTKEAIASVGYEKWKNAWSKFNISLVPITDEFNPHNVPVILVDNKDGIFYSYIKIANWILEDGTSNWTSDLSKENFINSLNLKGLKIVEMPLSKEERELKKAETKTWDSIGHFIIKLKII